jgi:transaldolase
LGEQHASRVGEQEPERAGLVSAPVLAALRRAGTAHVYVDSASVAEVRGCVSPEDDELLAEVDGNTANQPLVRQVLREELDEGEPAAWARELRREHPDLSQHALPALIYAVACARIAAELVRAFGAGRRWETSVQLHMGLCGSPEAAKRVARLLRRRVPETIVKVPFTPDEPHCFLVARDLEREGIPVNFTSTFSARQVVTVALLANVRRTNVFMGRLNDGLRARLLGEHVDLEAQRALHRLRSEWGIGTLLIVASLHDWRSVIATAGCDVFTMPCSVLHELIRQREVPPEAVHSRLDCSYEDRLGVAPEVLRALGPERISRLYRVEPELVEFLLEYRASEEYRGLTEGETLRRRFEEAGFGDLFHAPSRAERLVIWEAKVPDPTSPIASRIPLDTLYSLMADADFRRHQEAMDRWLVERAGV